MSYPGHSFGESYSSSEMQLVYSSVPADWTNRTLVGESYPSAEMQLVYSAVPADWTRKEKRKKNDNLLMIT